MSQLIQAGADYLARHGVDFPRVACELLACRLFGCRRLELHLRARETPNARLLDAWRRGLRRVAAGEPVQYVLGEWDFRGLTLRVDRRALIPRPETEELVDLVLRAEELWRAPAAAAAAPLIVDVGTGTGCIALALAAERPQARYVAIDASADALALARENAARGGLTERVVFRRDNGCGAFPPGSVDAIVANLPYIPSAAWTALPANVRDHEPRQALDGGADGLDVIRGVTREAVMVLRAGGWLFLEIGDDQGRATRDLLEAAGLVNVAILPDLSGRVRFARAQHGG